VIFSRPNQTKGVDFSISYLPCKAKKEKRKRKKSRIPSAADSSLPV
jgi:hypothetical protein